MRLFLIEDDVSIKAAFEYHCSDAGIELEVAASLNEAMGVIESLDQDFDLAVCDLKIPSVDGAVDEDVQHGLAALSSILRLWPGVPIIVLSAFGTVEVVSDLLLEARQIDIYGDRDVKPMLRFVQKARLIEALSAVDEANAQLKVLEQIELYAPTLLDSFRRAVRIFARRKGGSMVNYRPLAGGRSGAQTGLTTVLDASGAQMAHVVSKLTSLDRAREERERYISHVSGKLGAATFADLTDEVIAACGGSAGMFYSVADTFTKNLFTALAEDATAAAAVVDTLADHCAPWRTGVPHVAKSWRDIRRNLIADADFEVVRSAHAITDISDDKVIQCMWTSQHGDLHGANILIDDKLRPVLIDFGRAGPAPSVLDPVTLELSAIFHPDSPLVSSRWPTADDLRKWADLDSYLEDCPYSDFVRACRRWSDVMRVGQRDLFATVSAFCLRNLQYDDVDKVRALSLQQTASALVNEA